MTDRPEAEGVYYTFGRYLPVLLGFNTIELSRDIPLFDGGYSFRDIAREMQHRESEGAAICLTPAVGAEAVAGSTRLKGGTATRILLETLFVRALLLAEAADGGDKLVEIAS